MRAAFDKGVADPSYGRHRASSAADRTLRFDVERIDRLACRHEEAVALDPAETDVGAALGQHDAADHLAVGGEHDNAVLGLAAGPSASQITLDIDPHAVGVARFGAGKFAPVGGLGTVVDDIVDLDRALPWAGRVDDIEQFFIGRKGEPVRPPHVADRDRQLAGYRIEPIDPVRQFGGRLVAEIVAADTGAVVTEPDRAVGFDDDIVWAGQLFALEVFGQHGDRAVVLGASEPLCVHLTGHEATLAVPGIAVGVMGGLTKHADRARFLIPFHHPVVRDVAPDQASEISEPDRALIEAASARDHLYRRIAEHQRGKARVEGFYPLIRVADWVRGHAFLPLLLSSRGPAEGREPGTHEHWPLEYGFRARRPASGAPE